VSSVVVDRCIAYVRGVIVLAQASSRSSKVIGQLLASVGLDMLSLDGIRDNAVEKAIACPALVSLKLLRPLNMFVKCLADFWNSQHLVLLPMRDSVDFVHCFLLVGLGYVCQLKLVRRWRIFATICDPNHVIFSPELLLFLELNARLYFRLFIVRMVLPPGLELVVLRELRQLLAMDANCNISKFTCHILNHLLSSALVHLRLSKARFTSFVLHSELAVFPLDESLLGILMQPKVRSNFLEFLRDVLFAFSFEHGFRVSLRHVDVVQTWVVDTFFGLFASFCETSFDPRVAF